MLAACSRLFRPAPWRALALAAALTASLAGCGSDDADQAGAPGSAASAGASSPAASSSTAAAEPDPAAGTEDPTSSELNATRDESKEQGDFSAPPAASRPGVPIVGPAKGLSIDRPGSSELDWTVRAYRGDDDEFCVHVAVPGPNDPDPSCNSGTLLALQFFSDQAVGHAIGTVDQVPLDGRSAPTELAVTGVAAGDVSAVSVRYGEREYPAELSAQAVKLKVDKSMARVLAGTTKAQTARLPSTVTVRLFAVTFPRNAGNPPQSVTATTLRPVDGKIVLALS